MISLGQPSDLTTPTLHRYVYVIALSRRNTPDLVEFQSIEITAPDEDAAYYIGISSGAIDIPMDSIVHNDYVHKIGGNK